MNSQSPSLLKYLLQQDFTTSSNGATNWQPSLQMLQPAETFLIQTTTMPTSYEQKRIVIQLKDPIYSRGFWKVSLRKQYLEQKEFTEVGQKKKEDTSLEESADSKFLGQEKELKRRP